MASVTTFSCLIWGERDADSTKYYRLMVSSQDKAWYVEKRYSEFLQLSEALSEGSGVPVQLPELPPKSFFRRKLLPRFNRERHEGLARFLQAALRLDPTLMKYGELRRWLGVPSDYDVQQQVEKHAVWASGNAAGTSGCQQPQMMNVVGGGGTRLILAIPAIPGSPPTEPTVSTMHVSEAEQPESPVARSSGGSSRQEF